MNTPKSLHGDCECCDRTDVDLFINPRNIIMCAECKAQDDAASQVVETSRAIDSSIQLKADVFNAATTSFTELQASIQNNPSIADDQKNYALVQEAAARIDKLNIAIFDAEKALMEQKNERHAWLINAQNMVARLRPELRAKFTQYNVNYQPTTPKSVKPSKSPIKPKAESTFKRQELTDAAKKYGVDATAVRMIMLSKNMNADDAAKHFAMQLGLIK